jgi:hypothetical protein
VAGLINSLMPIRSCRTFFREVRRVLSETGIPEHVIRVDEKEDDDGKV